VQKRQRFVPNQRFDLPQYDSMLQFIATEFYNYNKAFISPTNHIVSNWKVEDAGGLTVRINNGVDSLLINSERTGLEGINYRASGMDLITKDLDDNAVNYVEIEIFTTTTGDDSVAIWDQSADSGSGEEFVQNSDTVRCESVRIVSNTTQYSVGQPSRIRLGRVTTSGGSITDIQDDRDFLFNLESDWDFDGAAFGTTRTDKTIKNIKDQYDAVTTSLKELKDTANWYDDPGISPIDVLERMNYMFVGGGNISWNTQRAASGHLVAHKSDPAYGIKDGDTLTIDDGTNVYVFEFDSDGSNPVNKITIPEEGTDLEVRTAILLALDASIIDMTASAGEGARIELVQDTSGTSGNIAITESISNGSSLYPFGMDGGYDADTLEWTSLLKIIAPSRSFQYEINAQSVLGIADGEVVYVTLPDEGVIPAGALTVLKSTSSAYQLDFANTRNYIIAYREGSKIYFGNGWHSVELEAGETSQLGDGITDEWLTATGLVSEFDSTPPFYSSFWITPGASFTKAISEHDQVIDSIYNMVMGAPFDEYFTLIADGSAGDFITLPTPYGMGGSPQTYQTGIRQLEVFFNGVKVNSGATDDYLESANVGAGIGDRIQLVYDLPENTKIQFRIQIGGGQDGTIGVDAPDVLLEGGLVASTIAKINFRDQVEVIQTALGEVDVRVRKGRELGRRCVNNTALAIPAGKVVSWEDDGSVILADANAAATSDIVGITLEELTPLGGIGFVTREGLVAGVAAGLASGSTDPIPGTKIYLSETAGELTVTPPPSLNDTIVMMGRAEPADGLAGLGTDLWLHPAIISEP